MFYNILLFGGWYLANVLCNSTSKDTLLNYPAPIILTFVQMSVGAVGCFVVLWLGKSNNQNDSPQVFTLTSTIFQAHSVRQLLPLVAVHVVGNVFTNFGIMHGSIAFVQIVKATEPLFTILWGILLLKEYPSLITIISALPIIAGVILVSYTESQVTFALVFSMLSNIAFSFRNVASKKVLSSFSEPTVLFYGINLLGSLVLLPLITFGREDATVFSSATLWSSGLFHFLYNWCSFLLLARLHVISHALGNVMKRAFVIIVGILIYNTRFNVITFIGIIFCVGGSLLYNYVGNESKNNNLSNKLKIFNYSFSLASAFSVLLLFSSSAISSSPNNTITSSDSSIIPEMKSNTVIPETPANNFMIFWTRLEQQLPYRLEKCVESILYHHKDAQIILFASYIEDQEPIKQLITEYPYQIKLVPIEVQTLLKDTPLEYWGRNHREWKWRSMSNFDYHIVDALRYAALWKYGGISIDADMVLLNPITQQHNFISDYFGTLTTKLLKFDRRHPFIYKCMERFADSYEPKERYAHGPKLVENVYTSYCKTSSSTNNTTDTPSKVCDLKPLIIVDAPHFAVENYFDFDLYSQSQHVNLLSSLGKSVAVDINYFQTSNIVITKNSFMDILLSKYSLIKNENYLDAFNLNQTMKFGTYIYNTINIGDEIQSIANIQYLPRIDYFIQRDSPMNYSSYPNITLIANGWYTWNRKWQLPPNIHPIFVSFHGSDRFPYNATKEYMTKMGPIGCRDLYTLEKFRQIGVNAYFSGCITTTLQNIHWDRPRENKIYITDPTLRYLLPQSVPGNQIFNYTHITKKSITNEYKWNLACRTLDLYMVAKLVITTRIHGALPSLAFGTPVIFTKPNKRFFEPLTNGMDPRWPGIIDLFTQFTIQTTKEEAKKYPYDNPPPNRNSNWMKKTIWNHLQHSPYIKESGRMFGVFKNLGEK